MHILATLPILYRLFGKGGRLLIVRSIITLIFPCAAPSRNRGVLQMHNVPIRANLVHLEIGVSGLMSAAGVSMGGGSQQTTRQDGDGMGQTYA